TRGRWIWSCSTPRPRSGATWASWSRAASSCTPTGRRASRAWSAWAPPNGLHSWRASTAMGDLVAAVPPSEAVPLLLRPHPYSADPGVVLARPGQTIAEMLSAAAGGADLAPLQVRVGGYEVPAELWDRVRPK